MLEHSLCLLLCLVGAAGAPSHPFTRNLAWWRAQQPSVFSLLVANTSVWDALGKPDWHDRLLASLPAVEAAAPPKLRPHISPFIPPSEEYPYIQDCGWCLQNMQASGNAVNTGPRTMRLLA